MNSKKTNRKFLLSWLIFHIGVAVLLVISYSYENGKFSLDSDLFNMMPKPFEEESLKKANETLMQKLSKVAIVLSADKDFEKAKAGAERIYEKLNGSPCFVSVMLNTDTVDIKEIADFFYKYRFDLLDDETIKAIENGGAEDFAQEAVSRIYSPFTMLPLDNIDSDPFMLAEHNLQKYLEVLEHSGTALRPKDGVLAAEKNGLWYVMIKTELSPKGAALASMDNGITEIYDICGKIKAETGTRCVVSGGTFHSHKSSNSASEEIKIISIISMIIVILMLTLVFRSATPIILSLISIFFSLFSAAALTFAVFGKVHLVTLVFGTSLIGSSIDYSLHYFVHASGNTNLKSGGEIRSKLLPGLTMAIISSSVCFLALIFAPFNLLKQMSLFSVTGLVSSFLTTTAIFPYVPLPENRVVRGVGLFEKGFAFAKKINGKAAICAMVVLSLILLFAFRENFGIENDLKKLYKEEGELLENEKEAYSVISYAPVSWFIVSGSDENEVLRKEEDLRERLKTIDKNSDGVMSTSVFIPSVEKQKKSRAAVEKLLPFTEKQFETLEFDGNEAENFKTTFREAEKTLLSVTSDDFPSSIKEALSSYWLGKVKDKYYSIVIPNFIAKTEVFRTFTEGNEGVYFVHKVEDINSDLDKVTTIVLEFFLAAYILMFIVLRFFYNTRQSLKIISIPFIVILATSAVFAATNTRPEFFSVTGIILVFGLGLDYIIYTQENEKTKDPVEKRLEPFAIFLSFFTTIVSFGALALSSFQPVHLIGFSIFTGLCAAYLAALFYTSGDKK